MPWTGKPVPSSCWFPKNGGWSKNSTTFYMWRNIQSLCKNRINPCMSPRQWSVSFSESSRNSVHHLLLLLSRDEDLVFMGFENHIEQASYKKKRYDTKLRHLMDTFGIKTEAEIVSRGMGMSEPFTESGGDDWKGVSISQKRGIVLVQWRWRSGWIGKSLGLVFCDKSQSNGLSWEQSPFELPVVHLW